MERKVDMIRLERPEEYYDREEIFGRNVNSVFPRQVEADQNAAASSDADRVTEMLGARRFISETQLEAIKSSRGGTADDGSVEVLKPLVEVLREAKERKETEFQDRWKQMKQGKNRPLDNEELAFMDKILDDEAERERQNRRFDMEGLEEYRKAMEDARKELEALTKQNVEAPALKRHAPTAAAKHFFTPCIKIKPKAAAGAAAAASGSQHTSSEKPMAATGATASAGPTSSSCETSNGKRMRTDATVLCEELAVPADSERKGVSSTDAAGASTKVAARGDLAVGLSDVDDDDDTGGLAGLLGGYGSNDEEGDEK